MIDAAVAVSLCRELQCLTGARIAGAHQSSPHTVIVTTRDRQGSRQTLVLSCHPQYARVHLTHQPPPPAIAGHFSLILAHHVVGGTISGITVPAWERIIRIAVLKRDLARGWLQTTIFVEMMGKHANIIAVGPDGMILDAVKRVGPHQSRIRSVHPGLPYEPPPPRSGVSPVCWQPAATTDSMPVSRWLVSRIAGLSPVWAREVCHRAGVRPDSPAADLATDHWPRIKDELDLITSAIDRSDFSPTGYRDPQGRLSAAWILPLMHRSDLEPVTDRSMNELVAELVHTAEADALFRAEQQRLIARLDRELSHHERVVRQADRALSDDQSPDRYRLWGELLTAYAHLVPAGTDRVELPDFSDPDLIHTVTLDPALSPIANAQALFGRYRRLEKNRARHQRERARSRRRLNYLLDVKDRATRAMTADEIATLNRQLSPGRLPDQTRATPSILRLRTPGGRELLVGRNNRQNDEVTFKLAQDQDLWLHARNIPGAHVILRTLPGAEPDRRCLEYAAGIAAYFSSARLSTTVPVDVARRRFVRRRPGAGPGQVLYEQFFTVNARPTAPPDQS